MPAFLALPVPNYEEHRPVSVRRQQGIPPRRSPGASAVLTGPETSCSRGKVARRRGRMRGALAVAVASAVVLPLGCGGTDAGRAQLVPEGGVDAGFSSAGGNAPTQGGRGGKAAAGGGGTSGGGANSATPVVGSGGAELAADAGRGGAPGDG